MTISFLGGLAGWIKSFSSPYPARGHRLPTPALEYRTVSIVMDFWYFQAFLLMGNGYYRMGKKNNLYTWFQKSPLGYLTLLSYIVAILSREMTSYENLDTA